ncbi:hypothetical protein [Pseudarthrobacter sp. H2]|uniref:hypothetical protein n=1 Tax=Pseudarthrobacter sp. H2 TaxID=3418415 RepID=UPI003CF21F3F
MHAAYRQAVTDDAVSAWWIQHWDSNSRILFSQPRPVRKLPGPAHLLRTLRRICPTAADRFAAAGLDALASPELAALC